MAARELRKCAKSKAFSLTSKALNTIVVTSVILRHGLGEKGGAVPCAVLSGEGVPPWPVHGSKSTLALRCASQGSIPMYCLFYFYFYYLFLFSFSCRNITGMGN